MKQATLSLLVLITAFTVGLNAGPVVYKIDSVHSGISFKIRHFINKVPGTFAEFSGEIHYDKENSGASKAIATVGVKSVDTRNADRDGHLQNEDFFNSLLFPEISFTSTEWTATGENTFTVTGDLTIKDITKPVTLEVIYLGEMEGRGAIRSGWEGKATIKRSEWGMTYGTPAVGDEVEIELNIQAHREA